jgi:hypothetical protein
MSDWEQLALIVAITVPIGLGLRFYLRRQHKDKLERLQQVGRSMSWRYYAAGAVGFLCLAVGSRDRIPFLLFFSAFAAMQLFMMVRQFIRERSQFGLRNLLIAVTLAAILFALCRWFGMAMVVVVGVAAGGAVLALYGLEWSKHQTKSEDAGIRE